jgi:hypothetical protein
MATEEEVKKTIELLNNLTASLTKELEDLKKENARLLEEISQPRCHDCHSILGDNWCYDCARKVG